MGFCHATFENTNQSGDLPRNENPGKRRPIRSPGDFGCVVTFMLPLAIASAPLFLLSFFPPGYLAERGCKGRYQIWEVPNLHSRSAILLFIPTRRNWPVRSP